MTLDEEIRRAQEAKMLLEHPLLDGVFKTLKENIMEAWRTSPVRDTEGRERLYMAVNVLSQVEGFLREYVTTGKLAAIQLEALTKGNPNELH